MFEKITEQELEVRGVGNVSTTPTKKTPFGESGFDAKQLKERFDLLPRYIAERLNEVLGGIENGALIDYAILSDHGYVGDILRGLYDGETAREISIKTPTRDITVADVAIEVVRLLDELSNGEFLKNLYFEEGKDLKTAINEIKDRADNSVPRMKLLGDDIADQVLGKDYRYNRVYGERSWQDINGDGELEERGTYARWCLAETPIPPPDPDIFEDGADPALREAYERGEYGPNISLGSVAQRTNRADIRVPARTIEEAEKLDPCKAKEFALSIYGAKMGFVPKLHIEDGDSNRYSYTVTKNSKGEMVIQLIKMGANPTPDVNQPLIRRRVNGAVGTLKIPEAVDDAASKFYVDREVASIVGSAPETLNALNELAAALGNDPNFATTVANQIGAKASQGDLDELSSSILEGLSAILTAQNEILGGGV